MYFNLCDCNVRSLCYITKAFFINPNQDVLLSLTTKIFLPKPNQTVTVLQCWQWDKEGPIRRKSGKPVAGTL